MSRANILVVDDDVEIRTLISDVLSDEDYHVEQAQDESEAIALVKKNMPNVVFLDLWIGEDESAGMKVLDKIQRMSPEVPVIIISGHGTIEVAVKAIQKGAFDFIEKPFTIDRLLISCERAIETYKLRRENIALRNNRFDINVFSVGKSFFAQNIKDYIHKIAATSSRVFIEAGAGSDAASLAFAIHKASLREKFVFACASCISNNPVEFERELFGSEKGYGFIERANLGTLYLENVEQLNIECQRKLIGFLQNGSYLAGRRTVMSDVRIMCSSDASIHDKVQMGTFNKELYLRLSIMKIVIPNLEDRREDIEHLVNYYIQNANALFGLKKVTFSDEAIAVLQTNDWPGNLRQLRSTVENALIRASGKDIVSKEDLSNDVITKTKMDYKSLDAAKLIALPIKEAKEMFERDYLRAQVARFSGNISHTAEFVGMERSALHRKLKTLDVPVKRTKRKML